MGYEDDETTPLQAGTEQTTDKKSLALGLSFIAMVFVGLGNKIFQVLQTVPMGPYVYFLNIWTTFIYIPLSFAYIIPMIYFGSQISSEQRAIPLYKFAIMGFLDGLAGIMQLFAVTKLQNYGGLVILLPQSAIPISMIISKILMKIKYEIQHYVGSSIVIGGLLIVLVPMFVSGGGYGLSPAMLGVWSLVLVLSCVPMTLSSVYKEKALGEQDIDVVYLNGWVAVFQFIISIPFGIPAIYAMDLTIQEVPQNFVDGAKCYMNLLPESYGCANAPTYVNIYIAFNVIYNILIIMILKYGSSNILWLAMTIMVPLGNAAFALPFVPGHQPMNPEDIAGLVVIMLGLIIYRFFGPIKQVYVNRKHRQMGYVAQPNVNNE